MKIQDARSLFPALKQKIHGHDLVYFDSAATTLKPQSVIDRMNHFYSFETANVHRGAHFLSDQATENFENTRKEIADFVQCDVDEVVFTSGTTESINLVASSFGELKLTSGDEVLIFEFEHHGNIIPWQILCEKTQSKLQVVKINDQGEVDMEDFYKKLNSKTKIVSISGCSNVLGTIPDLKSIVTAAHDVHAFVLADAAQLISQKTIRFRDLDLDFLVFSGHKIFGPTGVGALVAKKQHLAQMKPFHSGGSMIKEVTFAKTTYQDGPMRFEAGTPHIAGVIGLGEALRFFKSFSIDEVHFFETQLRTDLEHQLLQNPKITIFGNAKNKGAITSFAVKGIHHSDLSALLDQQGIAVRAGHLCAQPLLARFDLTGFLRVSFSIYNNSDDIQKFQTALSKAIQILG
ncbi:MAG: aminotransferase class V-fold PLP-dependent enzyme [Pseudobdellovibrionaceae bacterium]